MNTNAPPESQNDRALAARRLAVDAYELLATPYIAMHLHGIDLLSRARSLDSGAVAALDAELEAQGIDWQDAAEYPAEMPLYEEIVIAVKEGRSV